MAGMVAAAILLKLAPGPSNAQEIVPKIINGQPAGDEFPSVGIVGSRRLGDFCTGTLISPRHVLTVAHGAQLITDSHDGTFTVDGEVYSTVRVHTHPLYDSRAGTNDIAILELSESVPDITPSSIFRGIPQPGDVLIIVGFGAGGTADTGSDGTFGTKMYGMTAIEEVSDTLIIWQFNDSQESNTAPGDSGGPGFLQVGQELFVASMTAGGTLANAELGDIAYNTRVDAFADWIDTVVSAVDDGDGEQPDDGEDSDDQHPVPIVCASGHFGHPPARHPVPGRGSGRPGGADPAGVPRGCSPPSGRRAQRTFLLRWNTPAVLTRRVVRTSSLAPASTPQVNWFCATGGCQLLSMAPILMRSTISSSSVTLSPSGSKRATICTGPVQHHRSERLPLLLAAKVNPGSFGLDPTSLKWKRLLSSRVTWPIMVGLPPHFSMRRLSATV